MLRGLSEESKSTIKVDLKQITQQTVESAIRNAFPTMLPTAILTDACGMAMLSAHKDYTPIVRKNEDFWEKSGCLTIIAPSGESTTIDVYTTLGLTLDNPNESFFLLHYGTDNSSVTICPYVLPHGSLYAVDPNTGKPQLNYIYRGSTVAENVDRDFRLIKFTS